jgi:hypothetical protein
VDQTIRNKLRGVVTQCRRLLEDSVSQELQGKFGIYAAPKDAVQVDQEARMSHLTDDERVARKDILDHFEHIKARGFKPKEALDQLIREIAYTHLNRFCAYKMMEARQVYVGGHKFREAVSRGINSNGVKFYLADHADDERLYTTGKQDVAYRHFLDWLGGLLSEEIGVLFNPNDSANRLYPTQKVIDEVLSRLNDGALAEIWTEDEIIGWVYQYFTPKELRDQARKESAAPRNSYELAFRNQFFTPRYVVEFLTDNTLGRIWYEMRMGDTKLKDQCRYMVRRPAEVFLAKGEQLPTGVAEAREGLSQEELIKQPVHIPHRPKKDPRELKILDPACGSGHFLLYSFDLLLTIYEEAYDDPDLGPALKKNYPALADLKKAVPGLILSRNLHGIDIDLRCTQIAALALWLRCQRAYQEMRLKADRPKIRRSNIVCAEPMPGEGGLLNEFLKTLHEDRLEALIRSVMQVPEGGRVRATRSMAESLRELVRLVWDKMQLAGEAGALLKIEEDLQEAIRKGQEEWEEKQPLFRIAEFSLREESKEVANFWERAESLVMAALHDFVNYAGNGRQLLRKLFADDAAEGFAFVDLCCKSFDVVLMNPPFGAHTSATSEYIRSRFPQGYIDLYAAFVDRAFEITRGQGHVGAITSRTGFFMKSFEGWRRQRLLGKSLLDVSVHLGQGVLDTAMVETVAYTIRPPSAGCLSISIDLQDQSDKPLALLQSIRAPSSRFVMRAPSHFLQMPAATIAYAATSELNTDFERLIPLRKHATICRGSATSDDERFIRATWEVPRRSLLPSEHRRWRWLSKGGEFGAFYAPVHLVLDWRDDGGYLGEFMYEKRPRNGYLWGPKSWSSQFIGNSGIVWPLRSQKGLSFRVLPRDCAFSHKSPVVTSGESSTDLALLAILNSQRVQELADCLTTFGSYEMGVVGSIPIDLANTREFSVLGRQGFEVAREAFAISETDPHHQILSHADSSTLRNQINDLVRRIVSAEQDVQDVLAKINANYRGCFIKEDNRQRETFADLRAIADGHAFVSEFAGIVFGRWDVRCALHNGTACTLPEPFEALPICPPAMLQEVDGLPATQTPEGYPLRIDWDGVLVDDPEHEDDIVRRVRDVLEVIWKNRAEAIEAEACEILKVKDLREYFRKGGKGGFWDNHVSHYTKSRRKAPIYWLLQSSKKSYALWLYYDRLDKDLLFKALVNYVEPKIQRETNRLDEMRQQRQAAGESGKGAKKLDKDIERQEDLISELRDFEDKLRRAASLHLEPDLNDGVVFNIAPLHELVPWKEAESYWEELLEGKYEWSSIGKQLRQKGFVK